MTSPTSKNHIEKGISSFCDLLFLGHIETGSNKILQIMELWKPVKRYIKTKLGTS